jgi:hypothetical protein
MVLLHFDYWQSLLQCMQATFQYVRQSWAATETSAASASNPPFPPAKGHRQPDLLLSTHCMHRLKKPKVSLQVSC